VVRKAWADGLTLGLFPEGRSRAMSTVSPLTGSSPKLHRDGGRQRLTRCGSPSPSKEGRIPVTSLKSFHPLGEGNVTNASSVVSSPLLRWNPFTLVGEIAQRSKPSSPGGKHRTSSSPWPLGVGTERKKRRSQRRDRRRHVPGASLYSPSRHTKSGSRPFDQPSMAKEASGYQPGASSIPATCLRAVA
jgi:hypothetical protein